MTSHQKSPNVRNDKPDSASYTEFREKLKSEFEEIIGEPVPQRLMDLLNQLTGED